MSDFSNVDMPLNIIFLNSSEDHLAHRNNLASPDRYYRHAAEKIFTNNIVIYFNKNTCLAYEANQLILNLISGGFIDFWASKFIDRSFLKTKSQSNAVPLTIEQLMGAFKILCFGLVLSVFVLVLEILLTRWAKNSRSPTFSR